MFRNGAELQAIDGGLGEVIPAGDFQPRGGGRRAAGRGPPACVTPDGDPGTTEALACMTPVCGCTMLSGMLWLIMARAVLSVGGAAEYGATIGTGWPQGPCTPGTAGGDPPPQQPRGPSLLYSIDTQPLSAASSSHAPAVRFMTFPLPPTDFPLSPSVPRGYTRPEGYWNFHQIR